MHLKVSWHPRLQYYLYVLILFLSNLIYLHLGCAHTFAFILIFPVGISGLNYARVNGWNSTESSAFNTSLLSLHVILTIWCYIHKCWHSSIKVLGTRGLPCWIRHKVHLVVYSLSGFRKKCKWSIIGYGTLSQWSSE